VVDLFFQFFPACALLVVWFFILADNRLREDAKVRRSLHGRALLVDGKWRILQEDGAPLCDVDIATYFDELPWVKWDGRRE
jgi:hypothetical protein